MAWKPAFVISLTTSSTKYFGCPLFFEMIALSFKTRVAPREANKKAWARPKPFIIIIINYCGEK